MTTAPETFPRGVALLRDPALNKGTAFTQAERDALGLNGLLPARISTIDEQVPRVLDQQRRKSPLERYIHLSSLQDRNETLFYRALSTNLDELMPIVYTPTVGEACQNFAAIFRRPRGLYIPATLKGRFKECLLNWKKDARVIVLTDGERILGLGDLGANGMGIPVGKLALYTACAGIHPEQCLPMLLDVGTENAAFRDDPLYLGLRQPRLRGAEYDAIVAELIDAITTVFPKALIQLEDFATEPAFKLLSRYRDRVPTFDDDIQGTAAVAVAGISAALRLTHGALEEQRLLFLGAGEAGIGIAELFVAALVDQGVPQAAARQRCYLVDSKGLVCASRTDLAHHKKPFAHDVPFQRSLLEAVEALRPTALIGVSGTPQSFTGPVLQAMARINERPIVFSLSNPTSKSECTAEQAYAFTNGRAIFASGSPFPPLDVGGRHVVPGQGNNAYVFPGVGLGVLVSEARRVTDEMFLVAARTLAAEVSEADLALGRVYPALQRIREVSLAIGTSVAEVAFQRGLTQAKRPADLRGAVAAAMYKPEYRLYV